MGLGIVAAASGERDPSGGKINGLIRNSFFFLRFKNFKSLKQIAIK